MIDITAKYAVSLRFIINGMVNPIMGNRNIYDSILIAIPVRNCVPVSSRDHVLVCILCPQLYIHLMALWVLH
jgi:hypothetical protein